MRPQEHVISETEPTFPPIKREQLKRKVSEAKTIPTYYFWDDLEFLFMFYELILEQIQSKSPMVVPIVTSTQTETKFWKEDLLEEEYLEPETIDPVTLKRVKHLMSMKAVEYPELDYSLD